MGKAVRLFNGAAEQTLHGRVTPSSEQREFLQTEWNALAEYLKEQLATKHEYPVSTWLQGSYKFGTLIRPVHLGEEYDVDVGFYFEWEEDGEPTPAPVQLREWVQKGMLAYKAVTTSVKEVADPAKERCSRATYDRQFHIDVPVYHLARSTDTRRLARLSDKWERTDPKAIYVWFKGHVENPERDQLRRLIRYLKGWAAVAFTKDPDARPSSIVLTVVTTQAFSQERLGDRALDDEDALVAVVRRLHSRFSSSRKVPNPVDQPEDLNRIPKEAWETFLSKLDVLRDSANKAADADSEVGAALVPVFLSMATYLYCCIRPSRLS